MKVNILILNGSPRLNGNTAAMTAAFAEGAREGGHTVEIINICKMNISGCIGCEFCHNREPGVCCQKDDMQKIYSILESTEVIILASPIYFFNISGQLQTVISRMYAVSSFKHLKGCGMLLSSRVDGIFEGITEIYQTAARIMDIEAIGIITSIGEEHAVPEIRKEMIESGFASDKVQKGKAAMKLNEIREFARNL